MICEIWDEQKIEDYVRNAMQEGDAERLEDHVLFCRSCQDRVAHEYELSETIRVVLSACAGGSTEEDVRGPNWPAEAYSDPGSGCTAM